MQVESANLTELVQQWRQGSVAAGDELFAAVHPRLKRAAMKLLYERGEAHRLRATEILSDAYPRIARDRKSECLNRSQFISLAIRAIDRAILDAMRHDRAEQRDFRAEVSHEEQELGGNASNPEAELMRELEADRLNSALQALKQESPLASTVLLRKLIGAETLRSIAADLGMSEDAAGRKLTFAKAFLADHLADLRKSP